MKTYTNCLIYSLLLMINCIFVLQDIDSFLNQDITEEILLKKLLNFELRKKFNYSIENIKFKYKYKILHQNKYIFKN